LPMLVLLGDPFAGDRLDCPANLSLTVCLHGKKLSRANFGSCDPYNYHKMENVEDEKCRRWKMCLDYNFH
jgi:hypothetical protein